MLKVTLLLPGVLVALCLIQTSWGQQPAAVPPRNQDPMKSGPVKTDPAIPPGGHLPPVQEPAKIAPEQANAPNVVADPACPVVDEWSPSGHWRRLGHAPGGDYLYGTRVGRPYYYNAPGYVSVGADGGTFGYRGPGWTGYHGADPYVYHFGPGFHRHSNYGHYRFPYSNYRSPWYFAGPPSYNRDTNYPW